MRSLSAINEREDRINAGLKRTKNFGMTEYAYENPGVARFRISKDHAGRWSYVLHLYDEHLTSLLKDDRPHYSLEADENGFRMGEWRYTRREVVTWLAIHFDELIDKDGI